MLHDTPKLPRGSGRQLRLFAQLGRLAVRAEWRRGVGRQARQSGGGILLFYKPFLRTCVFETVQVKCTLSCTAFDAIEDCRTASLFDSPEKESTVKGSLALAAVIAGSLLSTSAEAQPTCRGVSTCESALATCVARRSGGMLAPFLG
jgi:hypothetical protein